MRSFANTARITGVAAATAALVGAGLFSANTAAAAEDQPIEPADAPEIMELAWPEYAAGDSHADIDAVTTYLTVETDADDAPYWEEAPTQEFTDDLSEVLLTYQADRGLGEHGEIKEELWGHFSDAQFGGGAAWGPGNNEFYTQGDTGEGVEALQRLLIHQGYLDEGEDDGQYGPGTEEAVEDFQAGEVCPEVSVAAQDCVDGLTGEVTYRALVSIE